MPSLTAVDEKRIEEAIDWIDEAIMTGPWKEGAVSYWKSLADRYSTGPACKGRRKKAMFRLLRERYFRSITTDRLREFAEDVFYIEINRHLERESSPESD